MDDYRPPRRVITIRDLTRSTKDVIRWMNRTGARCLVVRNGTPVATLEPIRDRIVTDPEPEKEVRPVPMPPDALATVALDADAVAVLCAIEAPSSVTTSA